jgi:hypothetical protein
VAARTSMGRSDQSRNARKAGATRVAGETPELDDLRAYRLTIRLRSLPPGVAEAFIA